MALGIMEQRCYAECYNAKCQNYDLYVNVVMLSVTKKPFMLSVVMLSYCYAQSRYAACLLCYMSFTLSVTNKPFILSVLMLNVIKLRFVAQHS